MIRPKKSCYQTSIQRKFSFFNPLPFAAINSDLRLLTATDSDDGENGEVKYSILQTVLDKSKNVFEVDSSSGMVTLEKPLDRETVAEHVLYIKAQDNGNPLWRLSGKAHQCCSV